MRHINWLARFLNHQQYVLYHLRRDPASKGLQKFIHSFCPDNFPGSRPKEQNMEDLIIGKMTKRVVSKIFLPYLGKIPCYASVSDKCVF